MMTIWEYRKRENSLENYSPHFDLDRMAGEKCKDFFGISGKV